MNAGRPMVLALLLIAGPDGGAQDGARPATAPVVRGLTWLLRAQNRDGSWGLDSGSPADVSCTAVAALALMAGGNTERGGPDVESVAAIRKAVAFVVRRVHRARGDLAGTEETLVQRKLGRHIHTF